MYSLPLSVASSFFSRGSSCSTIVARYAFPSRSLVLAVLSCCVYRGVLSGISTCCKCVLTGCSLGFGFAVLVVFAVLFAVFVLVVLVFLVAICGVFNRYSMLWCKIAKLAKA